MLQTHNEMKELVSGHFLATVVGGAWSEEGRAERYTFRWLVARIDMSEFSGRLRSTINGAVSPLFRLTMARNSFVRGQKLLLSTIKSWRPRAWTTGSFGSGTPGSKSRFSRFQGVFRRLESLKAAELAELTSQLGLTPPPSLATISVSRAAIVFFLRYCRTRR